MFQDHINAWFSTEWPWIVLGAAIWIGVAPVLYIYLGPWLVGKKLFDSDSPAPAAIFWPIVLTFWLVVAAVVIPIVCVGTTLYFLFRRPINWINGKYQVRMERVKEERRAEDEKWREEQRRLREEADRRWAEEQENLKKNQAQTTFREPEKEPDPCPTCGMKPFQRTPREEVGGEVFS